MTQFGFETPSHAASPCLWEHIQLSRPGPSEPKNEAKEASNMASRPQATYTHWHIEAKETTATLFLKFCVWGTDME